MNQKAALCKALSHIVECFHKEKDLNIRMRLAVKHNDILFKNIDLLQDNISNGVPSSEVWRNVIVYEGVYQISNFGNIKSLERFFIKNKKGGMGKMAVYQPESMRAIREKKFGYLACSYWENNKVKHILVHREVAKHFIPNPKKYPQVLHKDDNPRNARWDNLEWGTQSKNIQDCADKGRGFIGSKNGNSKLTEEDILKIRNFISNGESARSIAKIFGVAHFQILSIKNRKTWKHVK